MPTSKVGAETINVIVVKNKNTLPSAWDLWGDSYVFSSVHGALPSFIGFLWAYAQKRREVQL